MRKNLKPWVMPENPIDIYSGSFTPAVLQHALWYLHGGWEEEGHKVPSLAGLARSLDVCKPNLFKWTEQNDTFKAICEMIKNESEVQLVNGGLGGTFNMGITKLMLMQHGYTERVQSDVTSAGQQIQGQSAVSIDPSKMSTEALKELTDALAAGYAAPESEDAGGVAGTEPAVS